MNTESEDEFVFIQSDDFNESKVTATTKKQVQQYTSPHDTQNPHQRPGLITDRSR